MDLSRPWTNFAVAAEIDHFGTSRIVAAHNELQTERDQLRARVAALESGGCTRDQRTTQYCAEAVEARAECEQLRARVAKLEHLFSHSHEQSADMMRSRCMRCGLDLHDPVHQQFKP